MSKSEWVPTEFEMRTERGLYQIARIGDGWQLRFMPAQSLEGFDRPISIDCADNDGSPCDWPMLSLAQYGQRLHASRMADGFTADVAATWVTQMTIGVEEEHHEEQRTETREQEYRNNPARYN